MNTQLITHLPVILIILPCIVTFLIYQFCYFFSKKRWRAIHLSVQGSTVFYMIAVTILVEKWVKQNIIGYILIGLLLLLSIILIIQWKKKTEVILRNGVKVLLRISFLVFATAYFVLISYELFQMISIKYTN